MKKILEKILKILAILMLKRYKPKVIAITGNVGKTSAKDAVYVVLSSKFKTRRSEKSHNNEIGVPVTILGIDSYGNNLLKWLGAFLKVFVNLIWTKYPKVLILEFGADRPNDIDYLVSIATPDIAVVTAIGDVPAHIENFASQGEIVKEKTKLVKAVSKNGVVILNNDYKSVKAMDKKTRAKVIRYGFSKKSDLIIYEPEIRDSKVLDGGAPFGTSFKIEYDGSTVPFRIQEYGIPNIYAASSACAVAVAMGMNLVDASEALLKYKTPPGRFKLIAGIKNSVILDDSYNASPSSMIVSLRTFEDFKAKRKIAVLGSMLEIGKYSEESHRTVGQLAVSFCDIIVTVGNKARFIFDEAEKAGFKKGDNLYSFDDSESLRKKIKSILKEDDFILFKGSQGIRLEKAIKEILANPEKSKALLARQSEEWLKKN